MNRPSHPFRPAALARVAGLALAAHLALPAMAVAQPASAPLDPGPAQHLLFSTDFGATCVARNGLQILVRNTHPTRTLRVWLDRFHMGVGTGDRSRTDLPPGAEPDPLGCSRSFTGVQEWRLVRAVFVD